MGQGGASLRRGSIFGIGKRLAHKAHKQSAEICELAIRNREAHTSALDIKIHSHLSLGSDDARLACPSMLHTTLRQMYEGSKNML